MLIRKLQNLVVAALEDIKGRDIEVINTSKLSSMFERIVIASADSTRQVKALARHVQEKVAEAGGTVLSMEGEGSGEWVLLDLDSIVVHVMQPGVRAYYNLEELWRPPKKMSIPPGPLAAQGGDGSSLRSQSVEGPRLGAARRRGQGIPPGPPDAAKAAKGPSAAAPRRRRVPGKTLAE